MPAHTEHPLVRKFRDYGKAVLLGCHSRLVVASDVLGMLQGMLRKKSRYILSSIWWQKTSILGK